MYFFVRGHGGRSLHFVLRSGRNLGKGRELIIHARGFGEAYFLRDHGGQPALRRVQQRGAVVAQGFRLRHRRVAEHVGEIFQYLLAEPRRIGRQRQRQRRFPLADAPLQFHVKHSRLLLSGAPLIRQTSEAPYLFDCIL